MSLTSRPFSQKFLDYTSHYISSNAFVIRKCKICNSACNHLSDVDLNKTCGDANKHFPEKSGITVPYFRCSNCDFIYTDFFDLFTSELWEDIIYNEAYYQDIDPDYAHVRPHTDAKFAKALLDTFANCSTAIDYGAGNGLLSSRLRAMGYNYDAYDPFGHVFLNPANKHKYSMCTAFEVIEHTPNPNVFFSNILELCPSKHLLLVVGTVTHNKQDITAGLNSWWYAAPRNGHISLFSRKSLDILANKNRLRYWSLSKNTHIFYKGRSKCDVIFKTLLSKLKQRSSSHEWPA